MASARPVKSHTDLTSGSILKGVAAFAAPLIFSTILQMLYNTVDTYFVGQHSGTDHLAAVSLSGPVMSMMIVVLGGLSSGVSVVIAYYKGKEDAPGISKTAHTAFALYMLLALLCTVLGLLFTPLILRGVHAPAEAWGPATAYLRTVFGGTVFLFGYNLVGALQRGLGDSRSSMFYVMTASVVNILLDILFVRLLGMGALGAALGTVLAQGTAFAMGLWQLYRHTPQADFSLQRVRIHREPLGRIVRIGGPTALNEIMVSFAMLTVSVTANGFGLAAAAAYGVGHTIDRIAIVSDGAMNQAMASFASQNVGAGKEERARKGLGVALRLSGTIGLVLSVPAWIFAPWLTARFNPDPEVIALATDYVRIAAFSYVFFALVGPLIGFIRGTGNQLISVVVGLIAQYVFRVPVTLLAARAIGFPGVAFGILAGPVSSVVMYSAVVLSGKWKKGLSFLRA